jgi:hypothetical protein
MQSEEEKKQVSENNPETTRYLCSMIQIFTRYLSFNSLEVNRRINNLNEIILPDFVEQLLSFYEKCMSDKSLNE